MPCSSVRASALNGHDTMSHELLTGVFVRTGVSWSKLFSRDFGFSVSIYMV
jgi:hypothetical protein